LHSREPIYLIDHQTQSSVEAELVEGITVDHLRQATQDWKPVSDSYVRELIANGAPSTDLPQSRHWDWDKKMAAVGNLLAYRSFAITRNGRLEGLMIAKTEGYRAREKSQAGQHMVYVDYVETAPWNRPRVVARPELGGVGSSFVAVAIKLSRDEGFHGRIGLHSLPQSEAFYRRIGMIDLGPDATKQNLRYLEMTSAAADVFTT
jgi:hypothetical protein